MAVNGEQRLRAPFPYFGGKGRAAPLVWDALGDPGGYVEPFAGSAAVLLARPPVRGRRTETLNDADGWLVNTWRAIQLKPGEVARYAWGPVTEIDYHARLAWLQERCGDGLVSWLEGDPEVCDAKAAGWWLYVVACGIGDPFGGGPWRVVDGRLTDTRELPHLGGAGRGVRRKLPQLGGSSGSGVHRALPHLGNAGRGVHSGDDAGLDALAAYLSVLANRLQRVRITCGDWQRVVQPSVVRATAGPPHAGVFLDPPYSTSGDVYAAASGDVNDAVREWCAAADPRYRIVLCGYNSDHDSLCEHGWRKQHGKSGAGAGYRTDPHAGRRERLWMSPACLIAKPALFDLEEAVLQEDW